MSDTGLMVLWFLYLAKFPNSAWGGAVQTKHVNGPFKCSRFRYAGITKILSLLLL